MERDVWSVSGPVSATVELVLIIDYGLWKNISDNQATANVTPTHSVNLVLYFAHMIAIVSSVKYW